MLTGLVLVAGLLSVASPAAAAPAPVPVRAAAAAACSVGQSGAGEPVQSSGRAAVRTTIGVAKTMGVPRLGQIVAVMVMFQESSIRNLANDGSSTQGASWSSPGRAYWLGVTKLSLKYPHDRFGSRDGASDTDSIGLYQQRPSSGWGNYGQSTGVTDPEGVVQRLLDPRWEAMAFFGGSRSAAPTSGLLDIAGWQTMSPTYAANAVQRSNYPEYYAKWEAQATTYVDSNADAPAVDLPWVPGGGAGALACTSVPTDPAAGEAGRNPAGSADAASVSSRSVVVAGWALDPDAINGRTEVHVYDSGPKGTVGYPGFFADQTRDDVNRVYGTVGRFGFTATVPQNGNGVHTYCAFALNIGRGTGNTALGCRTLTLGPVGSLDGVGQTPSGISVAGWAADGSAPGARQQVHVYVTGPAGTRGTPLTTGGARADVSAAFPWAGGDRGFSGTVPTAGAGPTTVCAYGIGVNPWTPNELIGCRTLTVQPAPTVGALDDVQVSGNTARVAGWTYDPQNASASIPVHIYVRGAGGQVGTAFTADDVRTDVNRVTGVAGNHGYNRTVSLPAGESTVCAYGISTSGGDNTLLGCRTVRVAAARSQVVEPQSVATTEAPSEVRPVPTVPAPTVPAPTNAVPTAPAPTAAVPTGPVLTTAAPTTAVPTTPAPTSTAPAAPSASASSVSSAPPSTPSVGVPAG
ncbi:hypothetical protein JL107_08620 [Nakamurella flavida]|uniref:Mannosyl-glycoprotein endo-beta-N-acetylglucosamidase-like domain-containing protein n=1 Tax=Nakamurella flavida TaxID=363630 RepID=A0A938YNA2_9ACTN|nr:hypothetical protein [Nakamurella flavida]MBM9476502.1 hypothetical protein [Nakamurella flavida]MDP9779061.1 hypothetical protein [Nakamurella flavida]